MRLNKKTDTFKRALFLSTMFFVLTLGAQTPGRNTPGAGNSSSNSPSIPQLGDYVKLDDSLQNEMYGTIDFPNAELSEIIKAISKLANKNFILDNKIQNRRITIVSPVPVTKQDAYNAFLSALYMNNLTIVSAGKFLKIIETKNAFSENTRIFFGDYAPSSEEVVTVVYPLKHLSAEELNRFVADLVPRSGRVITFPDTNSIVMTASGLILKRVISILKAVDVPGQQDQLENIPIQHASAKQIATLLDEILEAQSGGSSSRSRRRSSRNQSEKKTRGGGTITKIVPDERTNSLVVLANGRGIKELKELVKKLDTPSLAGSGNIHIYYCKNSVAEELATTINALLQSQKSTQTTDPNVNPRTPSRRSSRSTPTPTDRSSAGVQLAGNVRVTADKATNSLVILASSSDYAALKQVLTKLDLPRRQVYVEATIMEIIVGDKSEFGVGVNIAGDNIAQVGGFRPSTMEQKDFASAISSPASLSGLVAGVSAGNEVTVLGTGGTSLTINSVLGLIRAIEDSSQGQILHQPQILIADNEEASIIVKDKIPVEKSEVSSVGDNVVPVTSYEKEEVKISLKITPQISEDNDLVKLTIEQSVDDFTPAAGGQIQITERVANTSVSVRNNDTVVIGGLQKQESKDVRSKFPLLGDLPLLGWLFKGSDSSEVRSQLVLFIKPKIIEEYSDLLTLTGEKLEKRKTLGKDLYDPEDRHEEQLEKIIETNKEDKKRNRGWGAQPSEKQNFSTDEVMNYETPQDTSDFALELEALEENLNTTPEPTARAETPDTSQPLPVESFEE